MLEGLVSLAVGLAAVILGLRLLGDGCHAAMGERPRRWLSAWAASPWRGFLGGIAAAALFHSSSASTIIVVALVHGRVLSLRQALPPILGANVGTTLTAQFLAWRLGPAWGWLALAAGWLLWALPLSGRPSRASRAGEPLAGLGLLLIGLDLAGGAVRHWPEAPWFAALLADLSHKPLHGFLAGAALTAICLSSTLTVALLQRLAASGWIPLEAALPVLFGDNVGTTADTLLASLGCGRAGRQAALCHLGFNLAGSALFLALLPWAVTVVRALSDDPARQIAHAHTLFNLGTALLLLPWVGPLAGLAGRLPVGRE